MMTSIDNQGRDIRTFAYAYEEQAPGDIIDLIQDIPPRWGRMTPLCRAMIVETGRLLSRHNLLNDGRSQREHGLTIGLVGGSARGSHVVDLAFADSMRDNPLFASPALFGYTLANIPLAEAANQFDLVGPVYAVIDQDTPFETANNEARLLLDSEPGLDMMIACAFDARSEPHGPETLSLTFSLLQRQ